LFKIAEKCNIYTFADDTCIVFSHDDNEHLHAVANEKLMKIAEWFCSNSLQLNTSKTKCMFFNLRGESAHNQIVLHDLKYHCYTQSCNCGYIEDVSYHTYLGVIIDKNVNWNKHISSLINKLRFSLVLLYKISQVASPRLCKMIYFNHIQSHLQYAIAAWGSIYKTALIPLQVIQKKAIRIVYNKPLDYPTSELFLDANALQLRRLYAYRIIMLFVRGNIDLSIERCRSNRVQCTYVSGSIACTTRATMSIRYHLPKLLNAIRHGESVVISKNELRSKLFDCDVEALLRQ